MKASKECPENTPDSLRKFFFHTVEGELCNEARFRWNDFKNADEGL